MGTVGGVRGSFTIEARGAFSLVEGIRFLEAFDPVPYEAPPSGALEMAFALEGSWQTVGVSVEPLGGGARAAGGDARAGGGVRGAGGGARAAGGVPGSEGVGGVRGRLFAARPLTRAELSAARTQVERILSLDVDGTGFAAVGERDPVVAGLQARYPGLRPVSFWSWYEAAAWAIIGQRMRITQAATVRARLAELFGETVEVNGRSLRAFPSPAALAQLPPREELPFGGLPGGKIDRLRALGEAARRNEFDSASLRALPRDEALARLQELPGVGPFSAELILLRGAGDPDHAPTHESHLGAAVAHAYGLPSAPSPSGLDELSANWAPYRTWVSLLLRTAWQEDRSAP